jgi:hypothetical protein
METAALTEQSLFDYIKSTYLEDLQKSEQTYEYIDATSYVYRLTIELKCRTTHYDELILEKDKYESLMDRAQDLGYTPFYINSTPKGIYAFNLRKITVTWITKRLPSNTFDKGPDIDKKVALLHIDKAVKL